MIRILIADDHELVRQGVRHSLERNPDWQVIAEAANGREAVEMAAQFEPDITILDLSMPEMNGIEALRQIVRTMPQIRVLVLSIHDSDTLIHEVLAAGAKGYLLKSDAARDLVVAVQSLVDGRPFFTAKVSQTLLQSYLHGGTAKRQDERPRLTAREQEVVRLVADGKTNKEMAALLNISVRTVETHRSNIMEKLEIHTVSDLILYAIRSGLKDTSGPSPEPSVPSFEGIKGYQY
jgi:DNA-binding NarL/FixJ family response regulator